MAEQEIKKYPQVNDWALFSDDGEIYNRIGKVISVDVKNGIVITIESNQNRKGE